MNLKRSRSAPRSHRNHTHDVARRTSSSFDSSTGFSRPAAARGRRYSARGRAKRVGDRVPQRCGPGAPDPLGAPRVPCSARPANTYRAIAKRRDSPTPSLVWKSRSSRWSTVMLWASACRSRCIAISSLPEDVLITDLHVPLTDSPVRRPGSSGDGGTVILPLQMGLAKAKGFFSKPVTAKQLAEMNAINAAVPATQLSLWSVCKDLLGARRGPGLDKVAVNKRLKRHPDPLPGRPMAFETIMRAASKAGRWQGISSLAPRRVSL